MSDNEDRKDEAAAQMQAAAASETPQDQEHVQDGLSAQDAAGTNETHASGDTGGAIEEDMRRRLAQVRAQLRENFGAAVMAMMLLPRYRHQALADLQFLLLEPMIRNRVAIAYAQAGDAKDIAGVAIWASVSEEVDAKIREQIRNGVFPVRLKPDEWTSGSINWLLDVFAPDERTTAALIANFRKVTKGGELRLHPVVARMLSREMLEKMGIRLERRGEKENQEAASSAQEKNADLDLTEVMKQSHARPEAPEMSPENESEESMAEGEEKKLH